MTEKQTVLITGANGLLGRAAVNRLLGTHTIHALVRVPPTDPITDVTYHVTDLGMDWTTGALPEGLDAIIHLAQSAHFREFPERARDVFQVNIDSTAKLLDFAFRTGTRRFIYASSGGIYGSGKKAFNENAPIVPPGKLGFYLGSKLCSEVLAQSYAAHMQVTVLRPFFMYGPGQKRSMLIPRLIDNIKSGRIVTIQGSNGLRINPVHVTDAAEAVARAMTLEQGAIFNIGGPEVLSLKRICETIGAAVGRPPEFEEQPGEAADLIGDISAMTEQLCTPSVQFKEGVKDLL